MRPCASNMHRPCDMLSSAFDSRRFCAAWRRYQTPTKVNATTPSAASSSAWPATVDGAMNDSMPAQMWSCAAILAASNCDMVNVFLPNGCPLNHRSCLLYTSDAADEEDSVDLGDR